MGSIGLLVVQTLFLAIILVSVLAEIKTGGTGIAALLGLAAAGLFFGTQYVQGMVSFYHIAIFFGGIFCLLIELITPVSGLFAAIGLGAVFYSFLLSMGGGAQAVYVMLTAIVIAVVSSFFLLKRLPGSRWGRHLILMEQSKKEAGYTASGDKTHLSGLRGIAVTDLRPAGTAMVAEQPVDVVSEGAFIKKGQPVFVVAVHGSRVIVRLWTEEKESTTN